MATTTVPAGAEPGAAPGAGPGGPAAAGRAAGRRSRWARARVVALLAASLGCAACGLVYELSLLNLAAILVGSSVQTTSLVLGVFVCAMGVGSVLSKPLAARPLAAFIGVEGALALAGGLSGPALYGAFAWFEAYEPVALGAATVIGALIGAEIPLLMALIGRLRSASSSEDAADVMAADYLGALVAGVAFPFALVPLFGLVSTTLAAGLLNLVLAAGVVLVMRPPARRAAAGLAALAVLAVALGAGLARSGGWVASVRQRLYDDPIVATAESRLQEIVLTRSFDGRDLRLFLDGDLQFSSVDEYRYHEALVHPAMAGPRRRVLILGGGDGMAAREVLRYDDVAEVVQVELDPAVTRLATEDPGVAALNDRSLADERVTVVHDDAFTWVADRARARREGDGAEPFDVVIVDVPDPESLDVVRLYSEEMYRAVAAVLAPDGRMVVQAGSPYFARQAFWSVEATVAAAGLRATPYHVDVPTFGDWGFVVGAPGDYALGLEGGVATRFLTPEVVAASQAFGADAGPLAVEVNTLDDPVLVGYTERGWSAY